MTHIISIINGKAPSAGIGGVSDADLSNIAVNFLSAGVVGTNDYKIEQQGTPNMTVKVNTGKAYIFNSALTMAYQSYLDAIGSGTITANASGNPRIDAVVIKIDTGVTPNNLASNVATIVVVAGTPAASPVAPLDAAIQTSIGAGNAFFRLANVTVANGAASITTANISDTRTFASPTTRTIKSATTSIDVGSATAPTTGQVLTATSGSAATWQAPSIGKVLQVIYAGTTTETSSTSATYADTTLTASITPASTSNKVLVMVQHGESFTSANGNYLAWKLLRGASDLITPQGNLGTAAGGAENFPGGGVVYLDSPSTTSATTYKTQFARAAGARTVTVQKNASASTIILMEIAG